MSVLFPFKNTLILLEASDSENGRNRKFMDGCGEGKGGRVRGRERSKAEGRRKERTRKRERKPRQGEWRQKIRRTGCSEGESLKKSR